ncbi:MAG: HD family hydrolase [Promethearchaeota archaeon]
MNPVREIIELARHGEALKRVQRSGWLLAGVDCHRAESVAEHSYGSVVWSIIISRSLLEEGQIVDLGRVITMAMIHDFPEAITSDIPHSEELTGDELIQAKMTTERRVFSRIAKIVPSFEKWMMDHWNDTEKRSSLESRIVASSDLLDMLAHAIALEKSGVSPEVLDQFFRSSKKRLESFDISIVNLICQEFYREHHEICDRLGIESVKTEH